MTNIAPGEKAVDLLVGAPPRRGTVVLALAPNFYVAVVRQSSIKIILEFNYQARHIKPRIRHSSRDSCRYRQQVASVALREREVL